MKRARTRIARGRRKALLITVVLVVLGQFAGASAEVVRVPRGYAVTGRRTLPGGIFIVALRQYRTPQAIRVAVVRRGGAYKPRVVVSNNRLAGPGPRTERTSSMCRRVRCAVAVNGDFFAFATGIPSGGVAADAQPVRSAPAGRHQLVFRPDGSFAIAELGLAGRLGVTYPRRLAGVTLPLEPNVRPVTIDTFNVAPRPDGISLFTPQYGQRTETPGGGTDLVLKVSGGRVRFGPAVNVTISSSRASGRTPIPSNGAVLSGRGRGAAVLKALWDDVRAGTALTEAQLESWSAAGAATSIGGSPVLLRGSKQAFTQNRTGLHRGRHARTIVGWNARGDLLLVTIDGDRPGYASGMTMVEAAGFMRALGATDAMNLDGGGSTSFVVRGSLVNRPEGSRERAVALALAIVPR